MTGKPSSCSQPLMFVDIIDSLRQQMYRAEKRRAEKTTKFSQDC